VGAETGGRERRNRTAVGRLRKKREKNATKLHPQLLPWKRGEGTSDNEEEDTDDVATVDDIDEGGDKKTTAKTLTADSKPGNNNEDGTDNDGGGNNKNENDDENKNENENEDDNGNGNEENESDNEDENGNENPSNTKENPTTSPHGTTPPPNSSTLDTIGEVASKAIPSQPGPPADPAIPRLTTVKPIVWYPPYAALQRADLTRRGVCDYGQLLKLQMNPAVVEIIISVPPNRSRTRDRATVRCHFLVQHGRNPHPARSSDPSIRATKKS
jgi:hypothetical protein